MVQIDREAQSKELAHVLAAAERAKKKGAYAEHKNYVLYAAGILRSVGEIDRALDTLLAARMYAEAAVIAEDQKDWPRAAQIWFRAGAFGKCAEAHRRAGDHRAAADLYARVGANVHAAREYLRCDEQLKAAMQFERAGDNLHAAQCYVATLKNRKKYGLDGVEAERVCRAAAQCFEREGEVDRAVRILEIGDQKRAAAEVLQRAGREEQAAQLIEEYEALDAAEVFLARARSGDRAAYGSAIQVLAKIEPEQKIYRRARVMMARALVEDDDRLCAIRVLKRLLDGHRFDRSDLPALQLYARLLIESGQVAEARGTLHTIVEILPEHREATTMLEALGDHDDEVVPIETQTLAQTLLPMTATRTLVGTTLRERFAIRSEIGSGAQASVYLGRDVVLDREVAVKVLAPELAMDAARSEAFIQEARFAARVHHRGCLAVYDFGVDQGVIFMAMELCRGHALSDLLNGRPLGPARAVPIAREVASALAAIHDAGIIHRDVKPGNILIDGQGGVRLADFGIATSLEGDVSEGTGPVGTLRYMAPEQADGAVDPRSDIYAIGTVLYEMLVGVPAFEGTVADLVTRFSEPPPELPTTTPVSAELANVLRRCLEPDPDARWPSMRALFGALAALG
ncbi:MAG: protein kinase [Deltaproteobacteria bacterium]